jgi:hypothetical protein
MMMLYNSESFAVMQFDLGVEGAGEASDLQGRGGYEIVDKFARKEIFLQGVMARTFKEGVEALMKGDPSQDELDDYIGRYTELAQHPVVLH